MKNRHLLTMIVALVLIPSSAVNRTILIDSSHGEKILLATDSDHSLCFRAFEDVYGISESEKEITYKNIQDYDMLLIGLPMKDFDTAEREAIQQFVTNGGGLLLVGEPESDVRYARIQYINSLSMMFGVEFSNKTMFGNFQSTEIAGQTHPIFSGISKMFWAASCTLIVGEPSKPIYNEGKCIIAYCEYGKGRIIFLPDSDFFFCRFMKEDDNEKFVANIFNWLTEPGGPFSQQRELQEKGLSLLEEGKEQMESGEFELAKSTLTRSMSYLESALAIYESDTIEGIIDTIKSLIADAETGIKASELLEEATALFEAGQYASALQVLEESSTLFQSINSDKSEECVALIQKCRERLNERVGQAEALLEEGIAYFKNQQYDLARARFEGALLGFAELESTEKIQECEEWISSCDKQLESVPLQSLEPSENRSLRYTAIVAGTAVIFAVIIGFLLYRSQKQRGRRSP